jgi:hypothetical protein
MALATSPWNEPSSWHGPKVACEQATGASTTQDHHYQFAITIITSAPIRSSLIQQLLEQQLEDLRDCRKGAVANYIPELAKANPENFWNRSRNGRWQLLAPAAIALLTQLAIDLGRKVALCGQQLTLVEDL